MTINYGLFITLIKHWSGSVIIIRRPQGSTCAQFIFTFHSQLEIKLPGKSQSFLWMNGWIFFSFTKLIRENHFLRQLESEAPIRGVAPTSQANHNYQRLTSPHAEFTSHTHKPHEHEHPGPRALWIQFCRFSACGSLCSTQN